MLEPRPSDDPRQALYGVLAEFAQPDALKKAARQTRATGFRAFDAFTPFPIEGLAEAIGFSDPRVPLWTLAGGIFGAALGYGMQVYTNLDYPLNVGGRPLVATTAFMLITFELMVLFAVLFGIGAMLLLNRLPLLHHPLFDVKDFHLASSNRFFLVIFSNDAKFDREQTREFLRTLDPVRVEDVPFTEEPE